MTAEEAPEQHVIDIFMMSVKFFVVTWFFMHLKNDSKLLTSVFYFGVALAAAVYVVFLLVQGIL